MWKDPIVEEVREAGARLAKKARYNPDTFLANLRKNQKKSGRRIVSFSRRTLVHK